jgi:hypothetical protein
MEIGGMFLNLKDAIGTRATRIEHLNHPEKDLISFVTTMRHLPIFCDVVLLKTCSIFAYL